MSKSSHISFHACLYFSFIWSKLGSQVKGIPVKIFKWFDSEILGIKKLNIVGGAKVLFVKFHVVPNTSRALFQFQKVINKYLYPIWLKL